MFTIDEVQALYFSMKTLNAYQSTPFHLSVEKLKEKFEACLSKERINTLRKMEEVFSLGRHQSKNKCGFLADILKMAISESVCQISYIKEGGKKQYAVQFFDITSTYGQWYATGYNFNTNRVRVFRCDKILTISKSNEYHPKPISEFRLHPRYTRQHDAVDFKIGLSHKGVDIFHKEHYPSMELYNDAEQYYIRGFFNKGEENFIANYFLMYGDTITSIQPDSIKPLILDRLSTIQKHISLRSSVQSD